MAKKRQAGKWEQIIAERKMPRLPGGRAAAIADGEDDRSEAVAALQEKIKAPPAADDPTGDPHEIMEQGLALVALATAIVRRSTAGRPWAAEYARAWHEIRDLRDELKDADAGLSLLLEAMQELLTDQLENEGIRSIRLADGRGVTTYDEPFAQVVDREKYRLWCIEQGLERQMHLAWATTNSLNKARLEAGEAEAPGVTSWAKTVVRKSAS